VDDLSFEMLLITNQATKLKNYIENQIASAELASCTPAQLQEFEETFRHFDKNNNNSLSAPEFKQALAALGKDFDDETFQKLFKETAKGDENISFEEFVAFMVTLEQDRFTGTQIRESFTTLANGKAFMDDMDMRVGGLTEDDVAFVQNNMDKTDSGYDYNAYLNKMFP